MQTYKRRHYYIDKAYQGRVLLKIILICAVGMASDLILFNYLSYVHIEFLRFRIHLEVSTLGEIVRSRLIYSSIFTASLTVAFLFSYLRSVLRQTAGPIYRLQKDIEKAAEGDLSKDIWLRGEDDFKETAKELNDMITAVRSDFKHIKEGFVDVNRVVNILEHVADKPEIAIVKCEELTGYLELMKKQKH